MANSINKQFIDALEKLTVVKKYPDLQQTVKLLAETTEPTAADIIALSFTLFSRYPEVTQDPRIDNIYQFIIETVKKECRRLDTILKHPQAILHSPLETDKVLLVLNLMNVLLELVSRSALTETWVKDLRLAYNNILNINSSQLTTQSPTRRMG